MEVNLPNPDGRDCKVALDSGVVRNSDGSYYGVHTAIPKRKCPTCKGTGINPVLPINVCPRCHGERVVTR